MTSFDLENLMAGAIAQLRIEANYFSNLTSHNPEKGRLNETHLVKMLRRYLPPKFGIGTGFIVAGGDAIVESTQCDIIIYDAINNTPFYSSDSWQIYPIEMVYGVIEVKTKITKAELKDTLKKCAALRKMCGTKAKPNKSYIRQVPVEEGNPTGHMVYNTSLPPRFFIFGYGGPSQKTVKKHFEELTKEISGAHIHGFCVLDKDSGMYISHIAFKKAEEKVSPVRKNGLWHFLMNMPIQLNSMLPVVELARFSQGKGGNVKRPSFPYRFESFDLVNTKNYKNDF